MAALMIQIATGDARPIVRQIIDAVRMSIATGKIAHGEQLPSVRGLAQQLAVNPNTVVKAYAELVAEGWLDSRQGMGFYVAPPRQRLSDVERGRRLDEAVDRLIHDVVPLGFSAETVQERIQQGLLRALPRKIA